MSAVGTLPLAGRIAAISGATGGIGQAVAARLAADGARVVLLGRDEGRLARTRDALAAGQPDAGADAFAIRTVDIASAASVEQAAAAIAAAVGPVDILVHAAGDAPIGELLEVSEADWAAALDGKLAGTIRLTRAVAAGMAGRRSGQIVFINGAFAREPNPLFVVASTVVAALSGFAKAIAQDLGKAGVRVNVINPGATETPLWQGVCAGLAARFGCTADDINGQVIGKTPLGRLGRPEDIAAAVAFLVSPAAAHIAGATLMLDGGASTAL